jgi:hypothetical protein
MPILYNYYIRSLQHCLKSEISTAELRIPLSILTENYVGIESNTSQFDAIRLSQNISSLLAVLEYGLIKGMNITENPSYFHNHVVSYNFNNTGSGDRNYGNASFLNDISKVEIIEDTESVSSESEYTTITSGRKDRNDFSSTSIVGNILISFDSSKLCFRVHVIMYEAKEISAARGMKSYSSRLSLLNSSQEDHGKGFCEDVIDAHSKCLCFDSYKTRMQYYQRITDCIITKLKSAEEYVSLRHLWCKILRGQMTEYSDPLVSNLSIDSREKLKVLLQKSYSYKISNIHQISQSMVFFRNQNNFSLLMKRLQSCFDERCMYCKNWLDNESTFVVVPQKIYNLIDIASFHAIVIEIGVSAESCSISVITCVLPSSLSSTERDRNINIVIEVIFSTLLIVSADMI